MTRIIPIVVQSEAPADKPAAAQAPKKASQALFAPHQKLFPRAVTGIFNRWRWVFVWLTQVLYFGLPWLKWNNRPAVWFDMNEHVFYLFGLVLWPSDVVYMSIILIICALALFLFTAVAGRLWCGYTCPQTVYTEVFMWIERLVEGNHVAQRRLDAAPMSASKLVKRTVKYGLWLIISVAASLTLVAYFTGAPGHSNAQQVAIELVRGQFTTWQIFWTIFYTIMMMLFAGFMREQVCKYMCPYARFQSVMFDADTLIVTYDAQRGESRGSRKKGIDPRSIGKGDCIDCGVCVDVCPTGIDIRNGLQYECIGCAACIDGCDEIMDKMGYPRGLIRYDTENGVAQGVGLKQQLRRILRGRIILYTVILWVLIIGMVASLSQRPTVKVTIEKDARTVARITDEGLIENVYRLQLSNTGEVAHTVKISATGINGIQLSGKQEITIAPAQTDVQIIRVRVDGQKARQGGATSNENPIQIEAQIDGTDERVTLNSQFIIPKQ